MSSSSGIRLRCAGLLVATLLSAGSTQAATYYTPGTLRTNNSLNRKASSLSWIQKLYLNGAHTGFQWDSDDNNTAYWRPQGITGYIEGSAKFLIVSWAAQPKDDYEETRGARISVVDVTSMSTVRYRHVLLVDNNEVVFPGLHAGGLAEKNGYLYVTDTRSGQNRIRYFNLSKIEKKSKLGYAYILRESGSYASEVVPSFLSYDFSRNQFLVGTFYERLPHVDEDTSPSAQLAWFSSISGAGNVTQRTGFHRQMQGAAADGSYLWTSHSFDRDFSSHIHVYCYQPGWSSRVIKKTWTYPAGLQDMHVSFSSDNIWMQTEFGPHEAGNNRIVFATDRDLLKPSGGC